MVHKSSTLCIELLCLLTRMTPTSYVEVLCRFIWLLICTMLNFLPSHMMVLLLGIHSPFHVIHDVREWQMSSSLSVVRPSHLLVVVRDICTVFSVASLHFIQPAIPLLRFFLVSKCFNLSFILPFSNTSKPYC